MAVNFYRGSKKSFTGISQKDNNGLYVLTNGELYLGTERIASGVVKVSTLPDVADAAQGILYILPTGEGKLFNGTGFDTIVYKTVTAIEEDTEGTAIPNVEAVKDYVATHGGTGSGKVDSVTAADASVVVGGTDSAPTIQVQISKEVDNALALKADGLFVNQGAAPEYTIAKAANATTGYATSYELQKDGEAVGVTIDIPKDFLVKDASIKTAGDSDPSGLPDGTEYIDFVVNVDGGDPSEKHLYIKLDSLVPAYTAGNGITISDEHEVAVKVVTGNGLSVDADGIKMNVASTSESGAMSVTDKQKLDSMLEIKAVDGTTISNVSGTLKVEKVGNVLTIGDKTFDGSSAVTIEASDLNVYNKSEVDSAISTAIDSSLGWKSID